MKDGLIMQVDRPLEIYNKPSNKFVASFIGSPPMNFMDVTVQRRAGALCLDEGKFILELLPSMERALLPYVGKTVTLGVRPEDIYDKVFAGNVATAGRSAVSTVESGGTHGQ